VLLMCVVDAFCCCP